MSAASSATGGRSMRKRDVNKSYSDDNPDIVAALARVEAERKNNNGTGTDWTAAIAAGLPPGELADFERTCCAIPDALRRKVGRVCSIRNHMLSRAARAPSKFMTLADAVKGLDPSFQRHPSEAGEAADAAAVYECLVHHGHLNWGVLDDHPNLRVPGKAASKHAALPPPPGGRKHIVVIGAGYSGLAAARQLHMLGHQVTVLEARDRTGGRVHTIDLPMPQGGIGSADLGAMVVTGTDGNPIVALAKKSGARLHRLGRSCRIYGTDGQPVPDSLDVALENEWNETVRGRKQAPKGRAQFVTAPHASAPNAPHASICIEHGRHPL